MVEPSNVIADAAALERLYGEPSEASIVKEVDRVHPIYRKLIEAAPFAVLATSGPGGLDASPRGDGPGFVTVADEKTSCCPTGAATTGRTACATSSGIPGWRCCS